MNADNKLPTLRPQAAQPVEESAKSANSLLPVARPWLLEPFRDPYFGLGLIMLLVSSGAFVLYDLLGQQGRGNGISFVVFMLHYGLTLGYSLILLINGHWRAGRYPNRRPARWIGLLLWLISAYALNRDLTVFQESTEWLCWALVVVGTAMLGYAWKPVLSVRAQQLLYFFLTIGCYLFAYMAVYVAPLYPISIPLIIGLGLSAHTFVPLIFTIILGKRLYQDIRREEHLRLGVITGLLIPTVVIAVFLVGWTNTEKRIEVIRMEATLRHTSDLPDWILMAQQLEPNWLTNRLLLSGRVYDTGRPFTIDSWGLNQLTALDDVKQHDPLVVIGSTLFPPDDLPEKDQLNLLKVLHQERHRTEEKFWTGRHLTTEEVVTQVRIWPQFRLSYTEKTIRIRNQAQARTEEALFTFYLPQGSVVSAMSLWVNGQEEPARLTTVAKADSAYRQIVNVESKVVARDPSVVYWQEGSRVTVRVFPCRAGDDRRVKLGITSPLRVDGQQLVYQNPYFEGPDASSATELVSIDFAQSPTNLQSPWLLDRLTGNQLTHRGNYAPDWALRLKTPALSQDSFVLDGRAYRMEPYKPVMEPFTPTDVYIDVNAAWESAEFIAAFQAARKQGQRVWIFNDGLKAVTPANANQTYEQLAKQRFSLFPVYRIPHPASALLITKGTTTSPTLNDLQNSVFANRMGQSATLTNSIRTFCIGKTLSPYLKTLAELRVLNVAHGTSDDLTNVLLKTHRFARQPDLPVNGEADQRRIVLSEAGVAIRESAVRDKSTLISRASAAPDHLLRLFAYNHLLQQIGRNYFAKNYQTDALIKEAQQAHIVSPLSSLVVLETANDYERFGIHNDKNGLDNATLKEEGAVPEPHEWMLLLMFASLTGWFYCKRYVID